MNVVAVDDELISLECLELVLSEVQEISSVAAVESAEAALTYLAEHSVDIAFLDIEMKGMNGLVLGAKIREQYPSCKIIFVTGTPAYAVNAFQLHADGYLVKPVTKEAILREIDYLFGNSFLGGASSMGDVKYNRKLQVQAFGNFEVFSDGEPLRFKRSKSKELLAYLIDRRGANCSVGELCAVLWEDKTDDEALQSQLRKIISDLKGTLEASGYVDILSRSRGFVSVLPDRLECDYYAYLDNDPDAVNLFSGEYMTQYSWAEVTAGYLLNRK